MNGERNSFNGVSRTWMRNIDKRLDSTVNEKVCKERHGNVTEIANEAKKIALAAKHKADQPHVCIKEDVLEDLNGWKKWLRAGIFSLAFVVILGIAAWYTQRSDIEKSLVKQEENAKRIESSVTEMKKSQEGILVKFKFQKEQEEKKKDKDLEEIKNAIVEAIKDTDKRNKKLRREP